MKKFIVPTVIVQGRKYQNLLQRLFKCGTYLRAVLIWKLHTTKNCIKYGVIIFRIKLTVFSLWLYKSRGTYLGRPFNNINFFLPTAVLIWV